MAAEVFLQVGESLVRELHTLDNGSRQEGEQPQGHRPCAGAQVQALGGGAALCVAALAAEGETRVSQICHIDRGYEDLARDLRALGADAVRVEETENG